MYWRECNEEKIQVEIYLNIYSLNYWFAPSMLNELKIGKWSSCPNYSNVILLKIIENLYLLKFNSSKLPTRGSLFTSQSIQEKNLLWGFWGQEYLIICTGLPFLTQYHNLMFQTYEKVSENRWTLLRMFWLDYGAKAYTFSRNWTSNFEFWSWAGHRQWVSHHAGLPQGATALVSYLHDHQGKQPILYSIPWAQHSLDVDIQ